MKRKAGVIAILTAVVTLAAAIPAQTSVQASVPGTLRLTEAVATGSEVNAYDAMMAKAGKQVVTVAASSGTDIAQAVKDVSVLAQANATEDAPYIITIPAGSYKLSFPIRLYSNTVLEATGATITFSGDSNNMIISGEADYNMSSSCKGYEGYKNLAVHGGIWKNSSKNTASLMKLMHATNVTLSGATFTGGGGTHQVELAALCNLVVDSCTFNDFAGQKNNETEKQESLQLDIPCAEAVYGSCWQDGTPMKNVTITNNSFSDIPRGLGTHTQLIGAYHKNLVITGNTFTNVEEECIVALDYVGCEISGNTITDCGAGVLVETFKAKSPESTYSTVEDGSYTQEKITDFQTNISANTITTKYYKNPTSGNNAIKLYGGVLTAATNGSDSKNVIPAGDYRVAGVTVTGNTVTTVGYGIHIADGTNLTVTGNSFTCKNVNSKDTNKAKYDGIFVNENCDTITLSDNTIKDFVRNGIGIQNATVGTISGNTIDNSKYFGIGLFNGGHVSAEISGNTISNTGNIGISISSKSSVKDIKSNTIRKTTKHGIGVSDSGSKVTGTISGNTLTDIGNIGICLTKGTIKSIENNKLTTIAKHAVSVSDSGKVTGAVKGNTIKTVKTGIGICLTKGAIKSIENNKITGVKKNNAIGISNSGKVSGAISGNTITTASGHGIIISKSKVGSVTNNTVSNVKKYGINIYNKGVINGEISGNTITSAPGGGIMVSTNSTSGAVSKNKISSTSGIGILVYSGSTTGALTGNTITKAVKGGISVSTNAKVGGIKNNTVTTTSAEGIFVFSASKAGAISGNTVTGTKKNAIAIKKKSTTGAITDNRFVNDKGAGVLLYEKVTVKGDISGNTYKKLGGLPVSVGDGCKVTGKVKANKKK